MVFKPWRFINDMISEVNCKKKEYPIDNHLKEASEWLMRGQDAFESGGVSSGYHLYHGWLLPYPETTGYIIETFFDIAEYFKDASYSERAIKMADWLHRIQNDDGAIPDISLQRKMVFDTGMVIFGFLACFTKTKNQKYLEAAEKAGEWLLSVQEKDGCWIRFAANGIPHTYYSRVAWSLLCLYNVTKKAQYLEACNRNIEWCLKNQNVDGWFNNASFSLHNHHRPFTHTIAYTIRGVLEAGLSQNNQKFVNAAINAIDHVKEKIHDDGFLAGRLCNDWNSPDRFVCLTGNAQLAIIFFKIAELTKQRQYFDAGIKLNRLVKNKQKIDVDNQNLKGGIGGSFPIWGDYIHFNYPNWAAKFFIDSLLLERKCQSLFNV